MAEPADGNRAELPQLAGGLFLADAGLETDLIFNRGIEVPEFAAHTLLGSPGGRAALTDYYRGFLSLAEQHDTGFILDSQTWKAHPHWARDLGASEEELEAANRDSIAFIAGLRDAFTGAGPVVLNGIVGPRGDAYAPDEAQAAEEAEFYHSRQIGWLADTSVDMITATTFSRSEEAIGFVRAARAVSLPAVISFTVETDGRLPTGQRLEDAILAVDQATENGPAYFMVNCAHPDHIFPALEEGPWLRRIRGLRCNASRRSHAELDESEVLDAGDPLELAGQYRTLLDRMPWVNVVGGCCGTDLRHVAEIARAIGA